MNAQTDVIRLKMHANKKAQVFSPLFVAIVIGLVIFALVQFSKKQSTFEVTVGERQAALMKAYGEADRSLWYSDTSLQRSLESSIVTLGQKGGFYDEPSCGSVDGYVFWINKHEECYPLNIRMNLTKVMTDISNKYFDVFLDLTKQLYPDNYQFFIQEESPLQVRATAATPIEKIAFCNTGACGQEHIRPSTTISMDYDISIYDELIKEVQDIKTTCLAKQALGMKASECMEESIASINSRSEVIWIIGSCLPGMQIQPDAHRFKICITPKQNTPFYESGITAIRPIHIKFAIDFVDNQPPEPVSDSDGVDYTFSENYILLKWKSSASEDVEKYNVYFTESTAELLDPAAYTGKVELPLADAAYADFTQIQLMDIDIRNSEIANKEVKYPTRLYNSIEEKSFNGKLVVGKNKLYRLQKDIDDPIDDYLVYALRLPENHKKYSSAVTPVDDSGNEGNIVRAQIVESIDDLSPEFPSISQLTYDPAGTITISWDDVQLNADGSLWEDWAGYMVYSAADPNGAKTVLETISTRQASYSIIKPSTPDLYYAISAVDDDGNEAITPFVNI